MSTSWGNFFRPRDSSGRESRTLFFVSVSMIMIWLSMLVCCVRFLETYVFHDIPASITILDFAQALSQLSLVQAAILGIWLGRDWVKGNHKIKKMELEQKKKGEPVQVNSGVNVNVNATDPNA